MILFQYHDYRWWAAGHDWSSRCGPPAGFLVPSDDPGVPRKTAPRFCFAVSSAPIVLHFLLACLSGTDDAVVQLVPVSYTQACPAGPIFHLPKTSRVPWCLIAHQPCAGAAGYGASQAQQSAQGVADVFGAATSAGSNAANGFGALMGSVRNGFNSTFQPHQPVTHVYHTRGDDGRVSWSTLVLLSGGTVAAVCTLGWLRGWDLFGTVAHARTRAMINDVRSSTFPHCL